jgi:dTDP-glucose 4,6-dehydratase
MLIAITGCNGFIGREVAEYFLKKRYWVYGIDNETYAADMDVPQHLMNVANTNAAVFKYLKADIASLAHLPDVDVLINFAAETHVDNSIIDPKRFLHSNIVGVHNLLELTRAKEAYKMPLFIQISTDEVYGDVEVGGSSKEEDKLNPSSPYAASKASADHVVTAYGRTFGVPYNIIRPSNCYGPHQYPEKLIPKAIRHLKWGKKIPIHNDGAMIRTWIHTTDIATAVETVIDYGAKNEIYNIGGDRYSVSHIVRMLVELDHPKEDWINYCEFNFQRKGLDKYYNVNDGKLTALGWLPNKNIITEIPKLYDHFYKSRRF